MSSVDRISVLPRCWYAALSEDPGLHLAIGNRFEREFGLPPQSDSLSAQTTAASYGSRRIWSASDTAIEISDGRDEGAGQIGNVIRMTRNQIRISSDVTGLFPAYFAALSNGFVASSHLHLLASAMDLGLDPIGEAQFFVWGYTVGERTIYDGARRVRPASEIIYGLGSGLTSRSRPGVYTHDEAPPTSREAAVDLVWDGLVSATSRAGAPAGPLGLYLSGGLDSRLIAAAASAAGVSVLTATHGQPRNSEVKIARRVAAVAGFTHHLVDLDAEAMIGSAAELLDLFWRADHVLFPVWRHAAAFFADRGATAASSGFALDATLGGHFHDPRKHSERLRRRLRLSLGEPTDSYAAPLRSQEYVRALVSDLLRVARASLAHQGELAEGEWLATMRSCLPDLRDDLEHELSFFLESGTTEGSKLVERYLLENHARKFSFSQELIARRWLALALPTADEQLLRLLASLPSHWLLDHGLYYKVLKRRARPFASMPGSNSPLPVTAPRVALELARAVRNRYDYALRRLVRASKGRGQSFAISGSANYEAVFRQPDALMGIEELLERPSDKYPTSNAMDWLREIADFRRSPLNMVPMTTVLTLRLAGA